MKHFTKTKILLVFALFIHTPHGLAHARALSPHKAIYKIKTETVEQGSQLLNIEGDLLFSFAQTCEGWITDHKFTLFYDYQEQPSMKMTSDISSVESFDASDFQFTTIRKQNDVPYEETKGHLYYDSGPDNDGTPNGTYVTYTSPENGTYKLPTRPLLPAQHTKTLLQHAITGDRYVTLPLFDGTNEQGTMDVTAFISVENDNKYRLKENETLYQFDLAFFQQNSKIEEAEYEMTIYMHKSGIITYMLIDYGEFTMQQSLKAYEELSGESNCTNDYNVQDNLENKQTIEGS